MPHFAHEGRQFSIGPVDDGWAWSVRSMAGELEASGVAPSRAVAAACVARATLAGLPAERLQDGRGAVERAA